MRRSVAFLFRALSFAGLLAPTETLAQASAPTPTVSITGFIDNNMTFTSNVSSFDANLGRNRDKQWYGRTRGRFDIVGEVGPAKGVFGFEIDAYWGQTGFSDTTGIGNGEPCFATGTVGTVTCGAVGIGAESSFDLNTDTQGSLQVKWLYTEFPVPFVPFPILLRLGAQPFGTAANYKLATYANGDFAGVNLYATFSPTFKTQFTYVAIDENLLGKGAFGPVVAQSGTVQNKCITSTGTVIGGVSAPPGPTANCQAQSRGDNWALIGSPEITLMKGLDVKPMISTVFINGVTSVNARQGRGGISILVGGPFAPTTSPASTGGAGVAGADGAGTGVHEYRHTIGVDARWRSGPWSVDPTFLYQFGTQAKWLQPGINGATTNPYGTVGTRASASISALLVDLRGGYQTGPWLFQGLYMWTSGNRAQDNPFRTVKYFQPLDADSAYQGDWGTQIVSFGVDYYQELNFSGALAGLSPGIGIGYDKYGRQQVGLKASYAVTPKLNAGVGWTSLWTDTAVDTDGIVVTSGGILPSFVCRTTGQPCRPEGDHTYLGTELDFSATWRFAPAIAFDLGAGYLFAGPALGHRFVTVPYCQSGAPASNCSPPNPKDGRVNDVIIGSVRIRFAF